MNMLHEINAKVVPPLDATFKPLSLALNTFETLANMQEPTQITFERNGSFFSYNTFLFSSPEKDELNLAYLAKLVKIILWVEGAHRVHYYGPIRYFESLKAQYSIEGERRFDVAFMQTVYEKPFTWVFHIAKPSFTQTSHETPINKNLKGCRIGFDAGGSDRKVSAVVDGKVVYSEEVVWNPKTTSDPFYHIKGVLDSFINAATHMPRVDAIGVSSAGVYVNNETRVASLFRQVSEEHFQTYIKKIYINLAKVFNDVPLVVANDGDVTALAGAMSLEANNVLGIAMGTSQAVGYVNHQGNITGRLNELAFAPVDISETAFVDEWSLDSGCGVGYFSQDAVINLASKAKIKLNASDSPADKLKHVQYLLENGHEGAKQIFETIGVYLGYALGLYAKFYSIEHILILGRVTSQQGGELIVSKAKEVIETEFNNLLGINIQLPDEKSRRVGQSIAAASLPTVRS